ncbi:MAG TPA: T9SS type A sorting domain-containing protein, partial [Caldithrix sp.]|nr:T9SS type A sorting domain-containing protein [Caldithrix sp.]
GVSWQEKNEGLTNLFTRAIAINDSGHIFVGTQEGIFFSDDNGELWESRNNGLPGTIIYALGVNKNGDVYAHIFMYGVYKSEDNGQNWVSAGTGLVGTVTGFVFNSVGFIFACTSYQGVYCSGNNGASWRAINDGLVCTDIKCMAIGPNDEIIAGSWGGGVFKSQNSTLVSINDEIIKPNAIELAQNYPNPFNPTTTIRYSVETQNFASQQIDLSIYNVLGQKVATLVNGKQPTGTYSVQWNAKGFTSGIYFCTLTSNNGYSLTRKLVLLK